MKILVSDNLSKLGVEILEKESGIEVDVNTGLAKEELIKIIPNYDGLIVRSATKVTEDVIAAAKNLKVVGRAGVGVDNIDLEAAGKKGHHRNECTGWQYDHHCRACHGTDVEHVSQHSTSQCFGQTR